MSPEFLQHQLSMLAATAGGLNSNLMTVSNGFTQKTLENLHKFPDGIEEATGLALSNPYFARATQPPIMPTAA